MFAGLVYLEDYKRVERVSRWRRMRTDVRDKLQDVEGFVI